MKRAGRAYGNCAGFVLTATSKTAGISADSRVQARCAWLSVCDVLDAALTSLRWLFIFNQLRCVRMLQPLAFVPQLHQT